MHSSYKISNSSDSSHLRVDKASVFRLSTDKRSEELRFFIEAGLEVNKLSATPEEDESSLSENIETLAIEPHSFNLLSTPITRELLLAEEKSRINDLSRVEKLAAESASTESNDSDNEPLSVHAERRKMYGGAKNSRPNVRDPGKQNKIEPITKVDSKQIFRRSQLEKQRAIAGLSSSERKSVEDSSPSLLPQNPLPVSDLPPAQVRSPPVKNAGMNPLLQNLKPIPLQQPAAGQPPHQAGQLPVSPRQGISVNVPNVSPAKPGSGKPDLISIQVPMTGADGGQSMQTINIPRSVLAGASDRPILLTVTPKNGVNKGQKQIVVLTRNNSGQTSATCHVPRPGGTPASSRTVLSPGPGVATASSPAKSVQLSPRSGTSPGVSHRPGQVTPGQRLATPHQPGTIVTKPGTPGQPPSGGKQIIRGHIVQTSAGPVLVQGNKQILLSPNAVQNGKLVLSPAQLTQLSAAAGAGTGAAAVAGQHTRIVAAGARQQGQGTRTVISGAHLQNMMNQGQKIVSLGTNAGGQQVVRVISSPGTPQRVGVSQQQTPTQTGVIQQNGGGGGQGSTPGATASLSRILTALHNRGLVSQQKDGKFYYVGDKTKSPVSISPNTAAKLASSQGIAISSAASATIPGITSLNKPAPTFQQQFQQQIQQQQSAVVVAPAANLDSFTADNDMMMMATSLMNNSALATNGDSQATGTRTTGETSSDKVEHFCYRDRALPQGWYIKIGKKQVAEYSYEVETSYYSPEGAMLQSQEQIQAYLSGQLSVDSIGHRPPISVQQMPWREDLSEINQQLVPSIETMTIPSPVIKRTASGPGDGVLDKRFKPDNNVLYA